MNTFKDHQEALAAAHAELLRTAKALRELDRAVAQMSESDMMDPAVLAAHLASVQEISEEMDAAIEAVEQLSEQEYDSERRAV